MLEALARETHPDLLVLDWEMPILSGRETCLFVRGQVAPSELPILILTGSNEALVDGLAAGANDYVAKPFRAEELTARVATLVALRRAHAKVVASDQALRVEAAFRERFIGILAHDLRQPLSTMLLAVQVLGANRSPAATDPASRALRAAMRMGRMVEELLDFTRSRLGGGMPIAPVEGDLAEIVRAVIRDRSEKDLISLTTEGDTRGHWDADRIAQVCSNLIGNALEYGAQQRPISVRVVGSARGIALYVHNEGTPIPADALGTLFDPFRGSSRNMSSGHAGLGLGLYIVDQILRAHGGTVDVRSGEDGTTFGVHLPAQPKSSAHGA
jgi:signal transduction histidine kinase